MKYLMLLLLTQLFPSLVKAEKVGWIAIGTSSVSNINTSYVNRKKKRYTINGIPVTILC